MRAALIDRLGAPPIFGAAPSPEPAGDEALIEVVVAPLNPIDLQIASGGFYMGVPALPYIPGKEAVGRIAEGRSLAAGTRVWFETSGGLGGNGSFAALAVAKEAWACEVPEGIEDALAAALGIAGLAAWLALEWRARLRPGETVLVLGASGAVGSLAVQIAKLLGAGRVVAAARSARGLAHARELGADATVALGAADDLASAFADAAAGGIDVVVDPLFGEPFLAAARAAAPGGRIVQLGQAAAPEVRLSSELLRRKTLSIIGHMNLETPPEVKAAAYRRLLEAAAAGRLRVDLEILPLSQVGEAWRRQARSPGRKLVLRP